MKFLKFNKSNGIIYKEFINRYNKIIEFAILNIQTFDIGEKEIFLVVDKGIIRK